MPILYQLGLSQVVERKELNPPLPGSIPANGMMDVDSIDSMYILHMEYTALYL